MGMIFIQLFLNHPMFVNIYVRNEDKIGLCNDDERKKIQKIKELKSYGALIRSKTLFK